jgi:chromate reductase
LFQKKDISMATPHNVVIIVGSLRKESHTLKVANALAALAPESLKMDVVTLHDISFFNQDLEATPPADWIAFREKLQKSNGVLFVTPEYNRSIPGVLKNAIDVASRPYGKSSFLGKPVGIVSNSPGVLGGVNAAMNLKQLLPGIAGPIMGQPEIYLVGVGDAFDGEGNCIKEPLQKVMQQYVDAFAAFVEKYNK